MNDILKKTHIKSNVDLLKARDYYFDFAKRLNLLKTTIVLFPPIILSIIYVLSLFDLFPSLEDYGELAVATLTVIVGFSVYLIDFFIRKYADISNQLRAIYDHNVLGVKYNRHIYHRKSADDNLKMAERVVSIPKYEVWYSEVFSDNHLCNVFCCQLDNLLYAKHAYKKAKRFYYICIAVLSAVVIATVSFLLFQDELLTAVLVIFSVFEIYDVFVNKISNLNAALELCTGFLDYSKDIYPNSLNDDIIETAQHIINKNRELCIFLPRFIRKQYLKDDNPFYRELDKYKSIFLGENAYIPETANDIDVVYEDGSNSIPLKAIQNRLLSMFEQVIEVFDKNGIQYMLDGGTLIGAMRKSTKGFIPWDDDIDITIPLHQIDLAKKILREQLDYIVQDADTETYYSTRLSTFRIREKNSQSMVSEKDSSFYREYESKGIFIDVYALSPVLISKPIDIIFRKLVMHPINRKLEKIENYSLSKRAVASRRKRFLKAKKKHLKLLDFYRKHAKNTDWYAYFPAYIYDLSKPGPYHAKNELYQENANTTVWELKEYKIPADPNAILSAYYGENWEAPPFKSKNELVETYKTAWFSKAPCKVTALKHITNIIFFNDGSSNAEPTTKKESKL